LLSSIDKGIICTPNDESMVCYADASFAEEWVKSISEEESDTARSRTCIVIYAGCPLVWSSKLQTEHAFSATEAEYVALSQALREVLPTLEILKELKRADFAFDTAIPKVH
jgi:hypothetical protein